MLDADCVYVMSEHCVHVHKCAHDTYAHTHSHIHKSIRKHTMNEIVRVWEIYTGEVKSEARKQMRQEL